LGQGRALSLIEDPEEADSSEWILEVYEPKKGKRSWLKKE
jgi:hypothetical protein